MALDRQQTRDSLEQLQAAMTTIISKDPLTPLDKTSLVVLEALVKGVAETFDDHPVVKAVADALPFERLNAADASLIVSQLLGAVPPPGPALA